MDGRHVGPRVNKKKTCVHPFPVHLEANQEHVCFENRLGQTPNVRWAVAFDRLSQNGYARTKWGLKLA